MYIIFFKFALLAHVKAPSSLFIPIVRRLQDRLTGNVNSVTYVTIDVWRSFWWFRL
jgi:hypothetical protein